MRRWNNPCSRSKAINGESLLSPVKKYFNNGGSRVSKGYMGAYIALGTTLLIFAEHLATKKYFSGGSLYIPKGEKVY